MSRDAYTDYIDRQIILLEEQVRAFEVKHGMTFEEYTHKSERKGLDCGGR